MATYYCDISGADSSSRTGANVPGQQWAHPSYGLTRVSSGDTLIVNTGTYTESNRLIIPANVNLRGSGKTGTKVYSHYVANDMDDAFVVLSGGSNSGQEISGISFDGDNRTGDNALIVYDRDNVIIHDCEFINFEVAGVIMKTGSDNLMYNTVINNCGGVWDGDRRYGLLIKDQVNFVYRDNEFYQVQRSGSNQTGDGIRYEGGNRGVQIFGNKLRGLYADIDPYYEWSFLFEAWNVDKVTGIGHGLHIYENDIVGEFDFGSGLYKGAYDYSVSIHDNISGPSIPNAYNDSHIQWQFEEICEDIEFYRNKIRNVDRPVYFCNNGTDGQFRRINIYSCLITDVPESDASADSNSGSHGAGFGIVFAGSGSGSPIEDVTIINCTISALASAPAGIGIWIDSRGDVDNVLIANNIIQGFGEAPYGTADGGGSIGTLSVQNNLLNGNGNSNNLLLTDISPSSLTNTGNIKDAPDFVSGSDYHLAAGSPAIAAGILLQQGTDIEGNAWLDPQSIGAYENYSYTPPVGTPVTDIIVDNSGGSVITIDNGTLQMTATVLPVDATNDNVTWSVIGTASIDSSGLLTAQINGNVTVRATAQDGSGVYGEQVISISGQTFTPAPVSNYEYGPYYNWYAVNNAHGLAPAGWSVPTYAEWLNLGSVVSDGTPGSYTNNSGIHLKEIGITHWNADDYSDGVDSTGDNSTGFNGRGAGNRGEAGPGLFDYRKITTYFWSSTEWDAASASAVGLSYLRPDMTTWYNRAKKYGDKIRLVKNTTTLSIGQISSVVIDGLTYSTKCMPDGREWMTEDLATEHYADGTEIPVITDNTLWNNDTTGAMCWWNNTVEDNQNPPPPPVIPPVIGPGKVLTIGYEEVEFYDRFNITYSIGDIRDLSQGSSDKSYTIDLPLTKQNRHILKHINQIDVKSEPVKYARIYQDEMIIIQGKIFVLDYNDTHAKIIINSDDWIERLKSRKMSDLDLSTYDHQLTNVNVEASWSAADAFYRYPMIDFGALSSGEIGLTANWLATDFIPMIRVIDLITMILKPYTIVSNWITEQYIKDLYILGREKIADANFVNGKHLELLGDSYADNTNTASVASGATGTAILTSHYIEFNDTVTDEYPAWDTIDSEYTVPETGTYRFKATLDLVNTGNTAPFAEMAGQCTIYIIQSGSDYNILKTYSAPTGMIDGLNLILDTGYVYLVANDVIHLEITCYSRAKNNGLSPANLTVGLETTSKLELIWNNPTRYKGINDMIRLSEYMPDMSQADFLGAVRDACNLRFWMDKSRQNIYFECWDKTHSTEIRDISSLIDYGSLADNPAELISNNYNRSILMKWKDDSSDEAYNEHLRMYDSPQTKEIVLTSQFCKDGQDIREHRWSTIVEGWNMTLVDYTKQVPRIWDHLITYSEIDFSRKVNFNTRLVHWDGYVACTQTWFYNSVEKDHYPKISGVSWAYLYLQYWQKIFHKIDKGKLYIIRMKNKPGFLTQFMTVISDVDKENFRPIYKANIDGVDNHFRIQRITSDGDTNEIELILE